ncbi:MAG: hypothetical protein CMH26_05635 [Micavibrio sp.]|nr:hypothetical protein [Micavibrio sp.]|tara:strand:+ start:168 stop:644 length:477 start_codon:yes stop_codon:yes gene_type:complete
MVVKYKKAYLTLSLIINVILIGVIGGMAYKDWKEHPWQQEKENLSPEARNIVGRNLQASFREMEPLGKKARKDRKELLEILTAEEFDGDAYDKIVKDMLENLDNMRVLKVAVTRDIAEQLPYEERLKIAKRMMNVIGGDDKPPHRRHGKRKDKAVKGE